MCFRLTDFPTLNDIFLEFSHAPLTFDPFHEILNFIALIFLIIFYTFYFIVVIDYLKLGGEKNCKIAKLNRN